jgi:predicted transcriptional regulator
MPTLKELRLQARLSVSKLARLADIDRQTVERAENGTAIQDVKAYAIVSALGQQLGRTIQLEEVENLNTI